MTIALVVPTGGTTVALDNVDLLTIVVAFEIVVVCFALPEVLFIAVFVDMLLVAVIILVFMGIVLAWIVGRIC